MSLEIQQRAVEGITVLDLSGTLILGPDDLALRQLLQSSLDAGRNNVILNLARASAIDTAGVGSLIVWAQRFHDAGGRLVLLNVIPAHTQLHDLLKLDTAIPSYSAELDAVNSFFPDRAGLHYDLLEFLEEQRVNKPA